MPRESQSPHNITGGAETILLVDDDADVRELVSTLLQREGYLVLEASGGAEALRLCTQAEIPLRLLLTDVQMPGMTGPELVSRALALRPQLSVLYMSAQSGEAFQAQPGGLAGRAFIQKPFTPEALVHAVRSLLGPSD